MKAMVSIGVDRVAGLFPPLNAAAQGAIQVGDWGRSQGFDVSIITDVGGPVTLQNVYSAVARCVHAGTYSQLFLYFSGHGVLQAPGSEIWLLSDAPNNPGAAINVTQSLVSARMCGFEHVVVVSDACRSLPVTLETSSMSPGNIFPNQFSENADTEVDVFYATRPGNVALELRPDAAVDSHRGLLTQCLLEALNGQVPSSVRPLGKGANKTYVVPARPLKGHLSTSVPRAAAGLSITLRQRPEARVESALPKYVGALSNYNPPPPSLSYGSAPKAAAPSGRSRELESSREQVIPPPMAESGFSDLPGRLGQGVPKVPTDIWGVKLSASMRRAAERILVASESNEDRTRLVVTGSQVSRAAVVTLDRTRQLRIRGNTRVDFEDLTDRHIPTAALVEFANGSGTLINVPAGYVTQVILERGRIVAVNHTARAGQGGYLTYPEELSDLRRRRALVAAAAMNGQFKLPRAEAYGIAEYLRVMKRTDPTLGIYACYAYAQAGDFRGVQSVYDYMLEDPHALPFDVAMLAAQKDGGRANLDFSPWLPMLTQGWMLLGTIEDAIPEPVREARKYLMPSLWTTFAPAGMRILRKALGADE